MAILTIEELAATLQPGQAIAGLDLGTKTIGLAMSDLGRRFASPRPVIKRVKFTKDAEVLLDFAAREKVAAFVIGLPYGVYGVAVCYTISEYLRTPFLWWFIGRKGPVKVRDMLASAGPTLIGAHLAIGGFFWLDPVLPGNPIAQAAIAASLTYSVSILIALIFPSGREAARNLFGMIPLRLQRKSS